MYKEKRPANMYLLAYGQSTQAHSMHRALMHIRWAPFVTSHSVLEPGIQSTQAPAMHGALMRIRWAPFVMD